MLRLILVGLLAALGAGAVELGEGSWQKLSSTKGLPSGFSAADAEEINEELWRRYVQQVTSDPIRVKEHSERKINYNGKTMHFHYEVVGKPVDGPMPLYIALHGGGGGPARMNDGQYNHMKRYYLPTVKRGIYCATRGVTNTWNLHFQPESYVCYDRLIENMIAFEGVDPNRVYIMGFSAGGDGVYQLAPRMADRWGAAAMSAGHPNGVNPRNNYNLPLLLQCGERDAAYDRNKQAVKYFQRVKKLRDSEGKGYLNELFLHAGRPHNFYDHHPQQKPQAILADPVAWMTNKDRKSFTRNTSSIAWLDQHVRQAQPKRVIWDRTTGADRTAKGFQNPPTRGQQHYWLDTSGMSVDKEEIVARLEPKQNLIALETLGQGVRLLLNDKMLDLDKPVRVSLDGTVREVRVKRSVANLMRTMAQRGDYEQAYPAAIVAKRGAGVLILKAE